MYSAFKQIVDISLLNKHVRLQPEQEGVQQNDINEIFKVYFKGLNFKMVTACLDHGHDPGPEAGADLGDKLLGHVGSHLVDGGLKSLNT